MWKSLACCVLVPAFGIYLMVEAGLIVNADRSTLQSETQEEVQTTADEAGFFTLPFRPWAVADPSPSRLTGLVSKIGDENLPIANRIQCLRGYINWSKPTTLKHFLDSNVIPEEWITKFEIAMIPFTGPGIPGIDTWLEDRPILCMELPSALGRYVSVYFLIQSHDISSSEALQIAEQLRCGKMDVKDDLAIEIISISVCRENRRFIGFTRQTDEGNKAQRSERGSGAR